MTIKEVILEKELKAVDNRLKKFIELGAPQIILEHYGKQVERYSNGEISIGGKDANELLSTTYVNHEEKKGRGGKPYVSFNNGSINYFPSARYGKCIYVANN